jgi:hypothetical protein
LDLIEDDELAEATGEAPECHVRARAQEVLDRVDELLSAPRTGREGAAAWEGLMRERNGDPSRIEKRAAPEAMIRKTRVEPAPEPTSPAGDFVTMDMFSRVLRGVIEAERRDSAARIAAALADANVRIAQTEARLALTEGRLAGVEAKGAKRK